MLSLLFTTLLATASYISSASAQSENVSNLTLQSVAYGGTGCPQGSLDLSLPIENNATTFEIEFTKFLASLGPGIPITENRKNCQVNLNLNYPVDYQFAPRNTIFDGYIDIPGGITATFQVVYYFSGGEDQSSGSSTIAGPRDSPVAVTDWYPDSLVWSPCYTNYPLNVNLQVRLTKTGYNYNSTASGYVYGSRMAVSTLYWRKCPI